MPVQLEFKPPPPVAEGIDIMTLQIEEELK
jgi:hypothetical protein